MRRYERFRCLSKKSILKLIVIIATISFIYLQTNTNLSAIKLNKIDVERVYCKYESKIVPGLGELGLPATLNGSTPEELAEIERGWNEYGYNIWLSERISLKRTLFDIRDKRCRKLTYGSDDNADIALLPKVSIIIVYYNEHPNVMLRTLHSIWQRTPQSLISELMLVNDCSNSTLLNTSDFHDYLKLQFGAKLKLLKTEAHVGLIAARLHGARQARAEVLLFLDAHVEVSDNWLPPLLAPIKQNPKIATTPVIDTIHYETFEYRPNSPARGGFNWDFNYVQLPLLQAEVDALPAPHNNPVMNGGLFAINAEWFWQLGAYDDQLAIWGGEQYELSFKLWLCGGGILEVPCSRVGHLYRISSFRENYTKFFNVSLVVSKNFKRVVEVWLDEYRSYIYEHNAMMSYVSTGDLSKQKLLRKQLNCKPFRWFFTQIASDILEEYPLIEPPDYAFGALQSVAAPKLCLDRMHKTATNPTLRNCSKDLRNPKSTQRWALSWRRDLRQNGRCLEVHERGDNKPIWLWTCHHRGGNQFWYYDKQTKMLVQGSPSAAKMCLKAEAATSRVYLHDCDFGNPSQQWNFGYINETALERFYNGLKEEWFDGVL